MRAAFHSLKRLPHPPPPPPHPQLVCVLAAVMIPVSVESSTAAWAASSSSLDSAAAPAYSAWASGSSHRAQSEVHLFNVTNPAEILAGGTPALVALPPLLFERQVSRRNVSWPREGAVSFLESVEPRAAAAAAGVRGHADGRGAARVSTLYMPGLILLSRQYGVAWGLADALGLPRSTPLAQLAAHPRAPALLPSPLEQALAGLTGGLTPPQAAAARTLARSLTLGSALLFTVRSADELLLGYPDDIFAALHVLDWRFPPQYPGLLYNSSSSPQPQYDSSSRGHASLFSTMAAGGARSGELSAWDGSPRLLCCASGPCRGDISDAVPAWDTPEANTVRGSASPLQFPPAPGEGARPFSQGAHDLLLFSPRMRRALPLVAASPPRAPSPAIKAATGLVGVPYAINARALLSAAEEGDNAAYFSFGPSGLFNASLCSLAHSPTFYSLPYFLHGNASLGEGAGLPPAAADPALYDSFFLVEPHSGTLLEGADRWQNNIYLAPFAEASVGLFPTLARAYLPLLWVSESYAVADEWVDGFALNFLQPRARASQAATAGGVFAAIFAVLAFVALAPVKRTLLQFAGGGKLGWAEAAAPPKDSASLTLLQSLLYGGGAGAGTGAGVGVGGEAAAARQRQLQQPLLRTISSHGRLSSVAELESEGEGEGEEGGSAPRTPTAHWSGSEQSAGRSLSSFGSSRRSSSGDFGSTQPPSPASNVLLLGGAGAASCSSGSGKGTSASSVASGGEAEQRPPSMGALLSSWGPAFAAWE